MENSADELVVCGLRSASPCQLFVVMITFVRNHKGVCYFGKVSLRN
jgi:hypothetical protein